MKIPMKIKELKALTLSFMLLLLLTGGCTLEINENYENPNEDSEEVDEADQSEETEPDKEESSSEEQVRISEPDEGETIDTTEGLTITGEARETWFFEGVFSVKLVDMGGNLLAQTTAVAMDDWMTTDWVSFEATFDPFGLGEVTEGKLLFEKANASGLPENDDSFEITVKFGNSDSNESSLQIEKQEFEFGGQSDTETGSDIDTGWDLKENQAI